MALRAETALAAGATRATRAELAMADMGRIDAKVRATRYAAIPLGRVLVERRRCQLTSVPAKNAFLLGENHDVCAFSLDYHGYASTGRFFAPV